MPSNQLQHFKEVSPVAGLICILMAPKGNLSMATKKRIISFWNSDNSWLFAKMVLSQADLQQRLMSDIDLVLLPCSHGIFMSTAFIMGRKDTIPPWCVLPITKSCLGKGFLTSPTTDCKMATGVAKYSIFLHWIFHLTESFEPLRIKSSIGFSNLSDWITFIQWLNRFLMRSSSTVSSYQPWFAASAFSKSGCRFTTCFNIETITIAVEVRVSRRFLFFWTG